MIDLFRFIVKYSAGLLFILLELVSITLLVRYNADQRDRFLSLKGNITLSIQEQYRDIRAYMSLRDINQDLIAENNYLLDEIERLRRSSSAHPRPPASYRAALVISNEVAGRYNRLLLNKGSSAGVKVGMGLLSSYGCPVGVIEEVTQDYAAALSILNMNYNMSVSVQGTSYFGMLSWEPPDVWSVSIEGLPAHAQVSEGDSIVTSGYSQVFPAGLPVGVITQVEQSRGQASLRLSARLHADVANLYHVYIADVPDLDQLDSLKRDL